MNLLQGKRRLSSAASTIATSAASGRKTRRELATLKFANSQELKGIEVTGFDQGIKVIVGERGGIHARSLAPKSKTEKAGR